MASQRLNIFETLTNVSLILFFPGIIDCADGSDEHPNCTYVHICGTSDVWHNWQCDNRNCVSYKADLCNGEDDCGDNSDEFCGKYFIGNKHIKGISFTTKNSTKIVY